MAFTIFHCRLLVFSRKLFLVLKFLLLCGIGALAMLLSRSLLELLYSDVWGPIPIFSTTGARYYISFLDDSIKFLWLFPLKLKSDALPIFQKFQPAVERQFNTKIKVIQTD